jgi:hypothetical protein
MDLHHKSNGENALSAHTITISSDTTTLGAEIDTQGFNSFVFFLQSGVITDGNYVVSLVESDTSGGTFTAVDSAEQLGNANYAQAEDNTIKRLGYIGKKRYVKFSIVSTSTSSGGIFSGLVVKSDALTQPVAD